MEKEEELFIPKTKYKGIKILLGIIIIAGLIVGGYFFYQYKFNNPKTIVNSILDTAKENINGNVVVDTKNALYNVDGHIKVDTNIDTKASEEINLLKDIEILFNGEIDPNNSISNININTKYKNDKLVDVNTYYEKNAIYLLLDGVYDKYLRIDINEAEEASIPKIDVNPKDIQTLANSFIDALKDEINKLELKREDTTITIEGNKIDVINNYIEFKDQEVNNFIKNIFNNLSKNKEFIETFTKLTGEDAETTINDAIESINGESFQGVYKINFYTNKGIFNKKLVSIRQSFTISGTTLSFNVDKVSDDEMKIAISMMGVEYSIKVKKTNSIINILLNMNSMGSYVNAEINVNYEKIKEITKPDVSNSKNINELTDAENEEISQKFAKNETILKLIKRINGNNENEA